MLAVGRTTWLKLSKNEQIIEWLKLIITKFSYCN